MPDESFVKNAADVKQVKAARKREKQSRREELDDLRKVLALPEGERLLWKYLERSGIFMSVIGATPHDTYRNEGQRLMGLTILHDVMDASPQTIVKMMSEKAKKRMAQALEEEKHDDSQHDDGPDPDDETQH